MSNFMLEALLGIRLPGVAINEGQGSVGEIPLRSPLLAAVPEGAGVWFGQKLLF